MFHLELSQLKESRVFPFPSLLWHLKVRRKWDTTNRNLKHCLKAKSFHSALKISVIANFAGKGNICSSLISSDKVVGEREKVLWGTRVLQISVDYEMSLFPDLPHEI